MSWPFDLTPVDPSRQPGRKSPTSLPEASQVAGHQIVPRGPSTVNLKRGRPPFNPFLMVCDKCKRRPEEISWYFADSGDHDLPDMTPAERARCPFPIIDCGRGYVHGYAKCHGDHAEFIATFDQVWASLDSGQPIHMFTDQLALEQKEGSPELTGEPEMKQLKVKE